MTEQEKQELQYRFSGYILPMLQLDSTGANYIILRPHPYLESQPQFWQKPHYHGHPGGTPTNIAQKQGRLFPFLQNDENT